MNEQQPIGIILTESSTHTAKCQLLEQAEKGRMREGMFLQVKSGSRNLLAYVVSIIPYNEFYTPGDAWSEARRKQWPIPEDVARQFEVCELELLGLIPGLRQIAYPPRAGDYVYLIDVANQPEEVFGVKKTEPGIIWYGTLVGYENSPIPLSIEHIPMHMAIFGTTGSGKSYDMGALIEKLVQIEAKDNNQISMPMLIIDANGDYLDYVDKFVEESSLGACPAVVRYVFPNSPELGLRRSYVKPIGIDLKVLERRDLSELIVQYYSGGEINELQVAGIEKMIENMEDMGDIQEGDYQSIFESQRNFEKALQRLGDLEKDKIIHSQTAPAIRRALEKFKDIEVRHRLLSATFKLSNDFVDNLTKNREIAIIDFSADGAPGVPPTLKQIIVAYLSSLLFKKFTEYKINKKERHMMFIMEESQNYVPNLQTYNIGYSLARQKLSWIATQGRKFGLSLCLISQRPSFVDPVVLSMCNTFFIHRISPEDVSFVDKVSGGLPTHLRRGLTYMERGEAIVVGQMSKLPFPVMIRVPKRGVKHTAGTTDVVGALMRVSTE